MGQDLSAIKRFFGDILSLCVNSSVTGRCDGNSKGIFFQLFTQNNRLGTCCEIAFMWISQSPTDEKSASVHVMAWCLVKQVLWRQNTSLDQNALIWNKVIVDIGNIHPATHGCDTELKCLIHSTGNPNYMRMPLFNTQWSYLLAKWVHVFHER